MEYTQAHNQLKNIFDPGKKEIEIPWSNVTIVNENFISLPESRPFSLDTDCMIEENSSFSYPVFVPANHDSGKVILLLHGLNERSWIKYLSWAHYLADNTGSYVVMFPISFHMNRSPSAWSDPRSMMPLVKERIQRYANPDMASFANLALSNRLSENPLRFFNSGHNTVGDIVQLLSSVRDGNHPVIPGGSRVNIFSYSIGAFLAQILMIGNPDKLFSESKLYMFCGGAAFSYMRGTSKLIMDKEAFDKVYDFYLGEFENVANGKGPLVDFLNTNTIGLAFRSMIDIGRLKSFRQKALLALRDQISSLSLLKDTVIPHDGISETMTINGSKGNTDVVDFPYSYSHENPFPVHNNQLSQVVDEWFERVFERAALFLG